MSGSVTETRLSGRSISSRALTRQQKRTSQWRELRELLRFL